VSVVVVVVGGEQGARLTNEELANNVRTFLLGEIASHIFFLKKNGELVS
jgi:hypothetical protein